ncbi:peptidoglycan hydrolase-like protein with peptidoglycan-binding domain [Hoeflea marina]|uniref:Peptidoglycan hydrolase-like protein with peptidoglycan-binding domain n=1 Tax=Hoeflea marina TaxID=274592 RepID=A0A317PMM2_9HYPH|nr:peptidoglycan-binding domain-containing protein [Hoeflea marina]PWW02195.1 peptidoglycan hydrolase-like protein with peptidoglycan-binding domain [Hoeflea marina]
MTRQRALPDPYDDQPRFGGLMAGVGNLLAAHPSLAGGAAAFAVIFGFVSANALWYQPGRHPAPILKTREVSSAAAPELSSAARKAMQEALADMAARQVTTYRITEGDNASTGSIPVPEIAGQDQPEALTATGSAPARNPLVADIQAELSSRGLYPGDIDGLMGPQSATAIRAYQKQAGLPETGEPTSGLLMSLLARSGTTAKPVDLPSAPPKPALKTDARAAAPVTMPAPAATGESELVRRIQSGLSNIAYADITVDGVAGSQTRNAIRAFEKHYRLPETGQPNSNVLKKLLEIGAL